LVERRTRINALVSKLVSARFELANPECRDICTAETLLVDGLEQDKENCIIYKNEVATNNIVIKLLKRHLANKEVTNKKNIVDKLCVYQDVRIISFLNFMTKNRLV
jgi:hypothetical protein